MKYLKTFESIDLEKGLTDFCETYLAYLLDGDFELDVIWQGHDYMVHPEDCYNINLVKLNDYGATGFTWNEVKDYYIPFLHMLNKDYEIMDEGEGSRTSGQWDVPCICLYNGSQNFCVSVKDVLSGEPLPGRYDDVRLLQITLQVMMKKITESVELKTDDIEHYLAYLIDEYFEVKSIIKGGGFSDVQPQQAICLEKKITQEEWRDILMTGLTTKSVIIGVKSAPMRVHSSDRFKPAVVLSNYKCELLDQIEFLAQDCADKLLLSLSDQFSSTKIIMSFKAGPGHVQQYNFGDMSIRLQIILIE
jgi:hypothetical protein